MMPAFGLILVLLLAKTLAQEDPEPIFKAVGETMEMGVCFGVDYMAVYRINKGEKQLLWNSSDTTPFPDAYRLNASSNPNGLLGFQVMDLKLSDTGVYVRECWLEGKLTSHHINYLYVCNEQIPSLELSLQNGGAVLNCDINYSDHGGTRVKWFREVYPGYKISMFLDTERSEELLQEELHDFFQVQDKGFSVYLSEASLEHNQNFFCLVMKSGECKSFKKIQLPESSKLEMQSVYYAVGEKAVLSCASEHLNQQQHYWKTPSGKVGATIPHNEMYISNSEGTRDHLLVIPSITFNHSGEYACLSSHEFAIVEYYITVCSELVSDNIQSYNGGKVILTCNVTMNESVNILWYRQSTPMESQLIYDSGDPSIDVPAEMMGRTHIFDTNASLIITEMNENDSGIYWCLLLLDSAEQDTDYSLEYDGEEDDNMDDEYVWLKDEESTEMCIIKKVIQVKIQPKDLKSSNSETSGNPMTKSQSSPVPHAVIGGLLGIAILGLIVVVVVKIRAKRKAVSSCRAEPTARQKDSAVSAPLLQL